MSKAKKGTADASAGGGDGRFFTTTKKGETHELRQELASQNREKKTDALKKARGGADRRLRTHTRPPIIARNLPFRPA
jgi:hypothetical protein